MVDKTGMGRQGAPALHFCGTRTQYWATACKILFAPDLQVAWDHVSQKPWRIARTVASLTAAEEAAEDASDSSSDAARGTSAETASEFASGAGSHGCVTVSSRQAVG